MPIQETLLGSLCCPVARTPLRWLARAELDALNAEFERGRARYATGAPLEEPLSSGLTTSDGGSVYRIRGGVPHLMATQRIVRSGAAAAAAPAPGGSAPLADVWLELSRRWNRVKPPLRPAPEDVEVFERVAHEALAPGRHGGGVALLLGATPEIATMSRPAGAPLLALDSSPAMVENVWPRDAAAGAAIVLADWKAMPVRSGACGLVIGDGILTSQRFPHDFRALAAELRRVVRDRGTLVLRLFARPETPDPLGAVFDDLRNARITNFDIFHWRLAMAMHRDLASGTRLADVWEAWHRCVPDPPALMAELGWAPDAARILETYRGLETTISFPTVTEVREILADGFEMTACHVPAYETGDRYPTVVLRPR